MVTLHLGSCSGGDEIESLQTIDPATGKKITDETSIIIYPANLFVTGKDTLHQAIYEIQDDMMAQIQLFEEEGRSIEAKRIKE